MNLTSNMIYQLGVEAGRTQMMDHIQHQYENEKPALINGELYWLTDSKQHLINIMDDIDAEYGIQKENPYIVPMHKIFDGKCMEFKVIISADTPYQAWCVALAIFEKDGWMVFPRYKEYEHIEGI